MFIISYVKNSSVFHILTPRKDGKYFVQSVEEAIEVASLSQPLPESYSSSSSSEFSK